ncbi:hypothetical protein [Thermobrachium celere]|uniref:Uncharacterized protein n=1 Tax=Thermobrachium celere DSM 8682 TaxID=941824 RepID=R7RTS3_9CLOT|nr:hypothetical protein [Thermobrachium celere]CDF59434.1 conserved hypothetical protein [Thermobrachium celere DSM 8682]
MKARVINKNSLFYGRQFEVDIINYKYVGSKKDKVLARFEDVEFFNLTLNEELIIMHRDILKISLPKALNGLFYIMLIDTIIQHVGTEFSSIEIVRDEYKELKRVWEKNILLVVDSTPLKINIVGQYHSTTNIDINITTINTNEFIKECIEEEDKLRREIEERNNKILSIKRAVSFAV